MRWATNENSRLFAGVSHSRIIVRRAEPLKTREIFSARGPAAQKRTNDPRNYNLLSNDIRTSAVLISIYNCFFFLSFAVFIYVYLRRFRRGRVLRAPRCHGLHRPKGHCEYPRTGVILSTGILLFSVFEDCVMHYVIFPYDLSFYRNGNQFRTSSCSTSKKSNTFNKFGLGAKFCTLLHACVAINIEGRAPDHNCM